MAAKYSDEDIAVMVSELKPLPDDYRNRIALRLKRGHKEAELIVHGEAEREYRLILRQSDFNRFDFSVILAFCPADSNQLFRLRRYNGKSHQHTNQLEKDSFYDFHIHKATERYQELGTREDLYALPTDRFSDFQSALSCMFEDCGFVFPVSDQGTLFGEFE